MEELFSMTWKDLLIINSGNFGSVDGDVEMYLPETDNQQEMPSVADTAVPTHFPARAKKAIFYSLPCIDL